jgi:hypothetical protein
VPLDHYVSQVHLKNFYSPELGNRMHALRKSDMKAFTPDAYSVCRIPDGSTNSYLVEERAIEEFLKGIEPKYNKALANVAADSLDAECIYVLAGFIAYVLTCSPTGMRIHSEPFKGAVDETGRLLDAKGEIGTPPPELGGATLTELLHSGAVRVEIDPKYPQAVGISSILRLTNSFGNFLWEILINEFEDSSFFTSDFPVSIEKTSDPRIINRIVPLSPTLAVRMHPNISHDTTKRDFSFSGFRRQIRRPPRQEIARINALLVRCAETTVFFRDNCEWVHRFVQKNSPFRIEPRTLRIPHNGSTLLWSTLEICRLWDSK